jgi:hypothetical protein
MGTSQQIEPGAPVWVWDQHWWPAVVVNKISANIISGHHRQLVLVRFEHGISAPVSTANIEPRDPALGGADKPSRPRPTSDNRS